MNMSSEQFIATSSIFVMSLQTVLSFRVKLTDIAGKQSMLLHGTAPSSKHKEMRWGVDGVRPTDSFVDSILNFPTPTSLTDIRSWFGAFAQVSYSFATSPVLCSQI